MDIKINKLQNNITIKYMIALLIIAIQVTFTFYTLNIVLKESNYTGEIVNISGKQRMLSQYIAFNVHRMHFHKTKLKSQILEESIQEMSKANQILSTGMLRSDFTIMLSPIMKEMYFGKTNLSNRVKEYLSIAETLIYETDQKKIDPLLVLLDLKSQPLLKDLDKAVKQYQIEGEERLAHIKLIELIAWVTTIFILLLEIIFIFRPMVNQIIASSIEEKTSHLKELNEKLNILANHDPLTGLKNRLNLENDIQLAISKYQEHNAPYGVLMFDIDWFKSVNDTYGHDVGDKVLIEISNILVSSVREEDRVYRAGGEEFVVLLTRISYKDITDVAQKIRLLIEKHVFKIHHKEFSKTISGSLFHSSLSTNSLDVKRLLKLIDTSLYKSKTDGRNRITIVSNPIVLDKTKIETSRIKITFADKTLNHILNIENNGVKELFTNKRTFLEAIYPHDQDILRDIPLRTSSTNPYISTIRLIDEYKKVHIYRIEAFKNTDSNVILVLQESVNLANSISDNTHIQNLHALLNNTTDYIYFKDRNHVFTGASKTLVTVTSVDFRAQLIGKTDYDVFDKDLADKYFTLERKIFDNKLDVAQEIQPTLDNDGNKAYVDNRKYPILDEVGNIIGLFGVARIVKDDN